MRSRIERGELLAGTFLLRSGIHAAFALWLAVAQPGWSNIFHVGSAFAIADGCLGLFGALLLGPISANRGPRLLALITFLDAAGRLSLGIVLRMFPGIPLFAVTVVSLFGAVGASAAALGLVAIVAWLVARLRAGRSWTRDAAQLLDPVAAAALVSFIVGAGLFLSPPTSSRGLGVWALFVSGALAVIFLIAAIGADRVSRAARLARARGQLPPVPV